MIDWYQLEGPLPDAEPFLRVACSTLSVTGSDWNRDSFLNLSYHGNELENRSVLHPGNNNINCHH